MCFLKHMNYTRFPQKYKATDFIWKFFFVGKTCNSKWTFNERDEAINSKPYRYIKNSNGKNKLLKGYFSPPNDLQHWYIYGVYINTQNLNLQNWTWEISYFLRHVKKMTLSKPSCLRHLTPIHFFHKVL